MKCGSCGGDNATTAARCQYCDQALTGRQAVDVAWLGQAGGLVGRGRLQGSAPGGSDGAARLRVAAESAFAGAVADLGPSASREALADAMRRRLAASTGDEVASLTVDALGPAPRGPAGPAGQPPPAKGMGCLPKVACVFLLAALSGCCLLFGIAGLAVSSETAHKADLVDSARLITQAEAAAGATGLVALEGQTATVTSAVRLPGSTQDFLFVEETQVETTEVEHQRRVRTGRRGPWRDETYTTTEEQRDVRKLSAEGLRLGAVTIASGPDWTGVVPLEDLSREEGSKTFTYAGVALGAPLTAIGVLRADGTLGRGDAGEPFLLATVATRAEVVTKLRDNATGMRTFGLLLLGVALLAMVATAGAVVVARRK